LISAFVIEFKYFVKNPCILREYLSGPWEE